jgi:two-component system chemotaxis response regulator CheY
MMIERYLNLTDIEIVAQASNGIEAIEQFEIHKPDLVTLDITMPQMDGLAALQAMLRIKPDAKIIMISALGSKATVVKAVNAGAASYLIKPLSGHLLIETINKIMGKENGTK